MTRTLALAALSVALLTPAAAEAKPAKVRAMTFNVRYDFKNDGRNRWRNRVDLVVKRIKASKAQVVCLQEDKAHQVEDLKRSLEKTYGFVGRGRNATGSGERCSILYERKTWKLKGKGAFWLSDTPDKPGSNTWHDKYPRVVTWAHLQSRKGGKQLLVLNTHLPEGKDDRLRKKGVTVIRAWLEKRVGAKKGKRRRGRKSKSKLGILVTGDFNSSAEETQAWKTLTADAFLRDAWVEAKPKDRHPGTYSGWRGMTTRSRIDWILVGGRIKVARAGKLDTKVDGRWPSDHYAVFADLYLY